MVNVGVACVSIKSAGFGRNTSETPWGHVLRDVRPTKYSLTAPANYDEMTTSPAAPTGSFILTMTSDELNLVISSLRSRATDLELLARVDPTNGPDLPGIFGSESKKELVSAWRGAAAGCRALASRLREEQVRQGYKP